MQYCYQEKGTSLIEGLIATVIFSFSVLQIIHHGLQLYILTRDYLHLTRELIQLDFSLEVPSKTKKE